MIRLTAENRDGARHVLEFVGWTEQGWARLVTTGAASYQADPATGRVLGDEGQTGLVLRLVPNAWRRLKLMARARGAPG